jgi:hypothetical protein
VRLLGLVLGLLGLLVGLVGPILGTMRPLVGLLGLVLRLLHLGFGPVCFYGRQASRLLHVTSASSSSFTIAI